jgi:hypothetical protein
MGSGNVCVMLKSSILSTTGRVVLINAVLTGVPSYAMGAMLLPPGVIAAIDARRRAFPVDRDRQDLGR